MQYIINIFSYPHPISNHSQEHGTFETVLHIAIRRRLYDACQLLMDLKADVNAVAKVSSLDNYIVSLGYSYIYSQLYGLIWLELDFYANSSIITQSYSYIYTFTYVFTIHTHIHIYSYILMHTHAQNDVMPLNLAMASLEENEEWRSSLIHALQAKYVTVYMLCIQLYIV